jgi:hypothetical protein
MEGRGGTDKTKRPATFDHRTFPFLQHSTIILHGVKVCSACCKSICLCGGEPFGARRAQFAAQKMRRGNKRMMTFVKTASTRGPESRSTEAPISVPINHRTIVTNACHLAQVVEYHITTQGYERSRHLLRLKCMQDYSAPPSSGIQTLTPFLSIFSPSVACTFKFLLK